MTRTVEINGTQKTWAIACPKSIPTDRSGATSAEMKIFLEVGLVMPGSRSQLRGVMGHAKVKSRYMWGSRLEGSLKTQSLTWIVYIYKDSEHLRKTSLGT